MAFYTEGNLTPSSVWRPPLCPFLSVPPGTPAVTCLAQPKRHLEFQGLSGVIEQAHFPRQPHDGSTDRVWRLDTLGPEFSVQLIITGAPEDCGTVLSVRLGTLGLAQGLQVWGCVSVDRPEKGLPWS